MSSTTEEQRTISTYFTKVSTLIRNSTPPTTNNSSSGGSSSTTVISDTIKLQLYGYYKVATTPSTNNSQGEEEKIPSIFNVVGRAKYNAIQTAKQHCTTLSSTTLSSTNNGDKDEIIIDKYMAMKCYLEVAASCYNNSEGDGENEVEDEENNVAKVCYELYNEMINKLDNNCDKKGETTDKSSSTDNTKKVPFIETTHQKTATNYSQQPPTTHTSNLLQNLKLSYRLPIQSLIPRGQIDITFYDLFITLLKCIICIIYNILSINSILGGIFGSGRFNPIGWSRWYETRIGKRWLTLISEDSSMSDATSSVQQQPVVITGLSIRSLLDLYLLSKSYPNGSEVIIAPSVSIPGMVEIMKYHGIKLVTVDLLSESGAATEGEVEERVEGEVEDNGKKLEETRWGINITQLEKSITKQTVAILIVHPFGTIISDSNIMKEIRDIVNDINNSNEVERDIEIWEDCAQCYGMSSPPEGEEGRRRGKRGLYTGSVYANISFFSFGTIKTSTALGGGLAILRTVPPSTPSTTSNNGKISTTIKEKSIQDTIQSMKRIQDTMYKQQSHTSYILKVIKCMLLHVISKSHLSCGLIKYLIEKIGFDYDMVVVSLLRGFKVSSSSDTNNNGSNLGGGRNELIQQIRHRPCMALLSLLYTRLVNSDKTQKHVHQRLQQYQSFAKRLLKNENVSHNNISLLKNTNGEENMFGWVFPILVNSQQHTSKLLLKYGYDVPCGMTQLQPVVTTQGEDGVNNCPRVRNVFDHILYLPVSNLNSAIDQQRLIDALVHVTSSSPTIAAEEVTSHDVRLTPTRQQRPLVLRKGVIISLGIFEWYFSIRFMPFRSILRLAVLIGPWIGSVFVMTLLLLLVLCHYMGPIYLESSNTFAKYCGMIFKSPFERSHESQEGLNKDYGQSTTVLELDSTKIPTVPPPPSGSNINDEPHLALLTGATGFIGSLLLRELLLHRQSLSISGGVIVIVRSKRGKSARERIDHLLSQDMFDFLSQSEKQSLVHVMEGNVTLPNCGMQSDEIKSLYQKNISHVFHCAAAVSFSQSLEDAAVSNITSSLQLQSMTKQLQRNNAKFVYLSTAFVHGGKTGTQTEPLPEEAFSLHPYDPLELYKSMLGTQSYASVAMNELGFPNTYTFSKCICEQLLLQQASEEVETIIIRPSIVGPSVKEPCEGWAGEKPSTIVAAACLYLKFPYNMWCFGKELVPFVPVDVVCRFVISKSFRSDECQQAELSDYYVDGGSEDEKKDMSPRDIREDLDKSLPRSAIATVAWDASSPASSSFSWLAYAFSITHLGIVCGHVTRVVAYAGLLLSTRLFPWLNFRLATFQRLHSIFIRAPLDTLIDVFGQFPVKPRMLRDLKALSPIIDLPMLFFPFANQSYYFKSDLIAPVDFNGERYMFSCAVAAHGFIQMLEKQRNRKKRVSRQLNHTNLREYNNEMIGTRTLPPSTSIVVAGSSHVKPASDLWWALTQPKGNLTIRFAGWILAKIFRYTSTEIEIDIDSFETLSRALSSSSKSSAKPHVILAPTHRSFYDFLIISYICFSLPELNLEIPHIAAASDFSSIPIIGWLAKRSYAFFLKRDGTKKDYHLKQSIERITRGKEKSACIEVFIEGKRSRDRTFVKPKTGLLRCLAEDTGNEYIILPLTINYESVPDGEALVKEANHGRREKMSLLKLVNWIYKVFTGHVNIGRVFISASNAFAMPKNKDKNIDELAYTIQSHQQSRVMVSNCHIKAASIALNVSEEVVIEAILELGCIIWPGGTQQNKSIQEQDTNQDLLWTVMLQFGHLFGPYLIISHPMWSLWLCPSNKRLDSKVSSNRAVNILLAKLIQCFERADEVVEEVILSLQSKGFHAPDEKHITQYVPIDSSVPLFVMQVAVKHQLTVSNMLKSNLYQHHFNKNNSSSISPLFPSCIPGNVHQDNPDAESFGAWGYQDSYFVLNVKPDGSKQVTMKGSRYNLSGKPLSKLASFVEEELNVVIDPNGLTFPLACDNNLRNIPNCNLNADNLSDIVTILGDDKSRVSTKVVDRARRGTGHTQEDMYELRTGLLHFRVPDVVVWPKDEVEVQALVSLAFKNNWCLIPFGGGTNVTHSTHCPKRDVDPRPMISVDMKLMCRVLWVNEEDGLIHVEAGITGIELIQSMEKLGFTIGHEPDSYEFSTLGGWIATKASGMKQNKYGNIEDIVREVSVVGATGTMSNKHSTDKSCVGRSSTGVDLTSIMLGSEGCFGIITSAVLKIWPLAESTSHESVLLPNFDVGMRYVKELSKMRGMKPASVRLLDNEQFRLGQALKPDTSRYQTVRNIISKKIGYYLGDFTEKSVVCATITFEGSLQEVNLQKKYIREAASSHGGILAGSKVGKAGYDLTFAIAYLRDFALNYNILGESFETFVPWSKLTQVIQATKHRIYAEHKCRALPGVPFVCSRITQLYDDGACVYFYFCMQISGITNPSTVFSDIEQAARQEILNNGGSLSHHHGLGKLRSSFVDQIYTQGYLDTLFAMKKAIDPGNIFGARNGVFSKLKG